MASYFNLTLDTTAPAGVGLKIDNGALYTSIVSVVLGISCSDASTAGYSMKIWGSVEDATTEDKATWISYATSKTINLTTGDGLKTVYIKVRDNVYNESVAVSATITLNTSIPVVTIVGPDTNIISKIAGKDTSVFNFTVDQHFIEYKVGVVPSSNSTEADATIIGTTGGSLNTSGTGSFDESKNIQVTVKGADFSDAAGGADGTYIVKVFAKNDANTWSK